jgi:hypothetical protein
MANPSTATSTATSTAASTVVNEAVRIAAEGSRRSTQSAQAALQAGRAYFEQTAQINRDLFALFTAGADAGMRTAFEVQNASLASASAWFDAYASLSKSAIARSADLARQAQATTLKTYQAGSQLVSDTLTTPY